jgi:DNA-binding MarR family transcriptional regulator
VSKLNQSSLQDFSTYRTAALQATAYRKLREFMSNTLTPHGLSCAEWSILGIVHEESKNGGVRVGQLAELLDVQISFVTNMTRRLQSIGYVSHRFDDDDGRVRLIVCSDKGHLKAIKIEAELRAGMRAWLNGIDQQDLLAYIKVLGYISNK